MKKHLLLLLFCTAAAAILFTGCLTAEKTETRKPAPSSNGKSAPAEQNISDENRKPDVFGSLFVTTITAGEVSIDTGETFFLPENGSILINKLEPGTYKVLIRYADEQEEQLTARIEENTKTEVAFTWIPKPDKMQTPAESEENGGDLPVSDEEKALQNGETSRSTTADAGTGTGDKSQENPIREIRLLTGTYTGLLKDGKRHGYGRMELLNGDQYEGEWYKDRKHGFGTYIWEHGDVYKGQWQHDKRHGTGTYTLANGDTYSGSWKEGKMHGIGIYTWANGDYYEGRWSEGEKEGKGLYKTADGDSYEGEWEDDTMNGTGTFIWSDGDRYTGEWKNGLMHGEGTFYIAYRGRYEGTFENGRAVGGWYYLQDGTKKWAAMNENGEWELKEKAPATAPSS